MEELKLLLEMVAGLPSMALWVIAMVFAYKVVCVGSVYGVIRFTVGKLHDWLTSRSRTEQVWPKIQDFTITGSYDDLLTQLRRLRNAGFREKFGETSHSTGYIHSDDVDWLRRAIDDKEAKDSAVHAVRKARTAA